MRRYRWYVFVRGILKARIFVASQGVFLVLWILVVSNGARDLDAQIRGTCLLGIY